MRYHVLFFFGCERIRKRHCSSGQKGWGGSERKKNRCAAGGKIVYERNGVVALAVGGVCVAQIKGGRDK